MSIQTKEMQKKKKAESDERPNYVKINVDFRVIPYGTKKKNQKLKQIWVEADELEASPPFPFS